MNIGEKISKARKDKGLTQADLGNKIHVTFQAVSKWERGESVPDFETICELSEVLGVPITYFGGKSADEKEEQNVAATVSVQPVPKPVLAVCEKCNKPIYDGKEIVRYHLGNGAHVKCAECDRKEKAAKLSSAIENGKKRRIHSFIWPPLIMIIGIIICACTLKGSDRVYGIIFSVLLFPLSACLILYNNVVGEVVINIITWSAVKFPGIIFSFDLDGFVFLIAMKILFFFIGLALTVMCVAFSLIVGEVVSVFVYPYAISKNFKYPEKGEYSDFD